MRARLLLALLLSCFAGSVEAQWTENGVPIADTTWRQSKNGFGVLLGLTDQPQAFRKAWSEVGREVPVSMPDEVRRGSDVMAFIIFNGCPENEAGHCDVDLDIQIVNPKGKTLALLSDVVFWKGPSPRPPKIELATTGLGGRIASRVPRGEYVVRAQVIDRVTNLRFILERRFTVK